MNPKTIKPLTLPSLPLADRSQLPVCPAVYFVLDGDAVLYIGSTKNLQQRWLAHHRWYQLKVMSGNIRIAWLECSDASLLVAIETASIEHFEPSLNRTRVEGEQNTIKLVIPKALKIRFKALCVRAQRDMSSVGSQLIENWCQEQEQAEAKRDESNT
ncbi:MULTISPECIES: GIY-YIG nuclease family protein [unclassified Microcoleus]|uniref:GIY-YIG nuclease family protein n=1 Tax=unclassified Microcoleus TaxID=2642155 RepID=UPI002FD36D31